MIDRNYISGIEYNLKIKNILEATEEFVKNNNGDYIMFRYVFAYYLNTLTSIPLTAGDRMLGLKVGKLRTTLLRSRYSKDEKINKKLRETIL